MATREINGRILIEGYASPAKRQLWRVVDGAVRDGMTAHPDWFNGNTSLRLRNSIVKRVVGSIMGYAETSAWGRSGLSPAADGAGERLAAPIDVRPDLGSASSTDGAAFSSSVLPALERASQGARFGGEGAR